MQFLMVTSFMAVLFGLLPAAMAVVIPIIDVASQGTNTSAIGPTTANQKTSASDNGGFWADVSGSFEVDSTFLWLYAQVPYRGRWENLPLEYCISNINGIMSPVFNGDFSSTCYSCTLWTTQFSCTCYKLDGTVMTSTLDLNAFIGIDINNRLACFDQNGGFDGPDGGPMVPGSNPPKVL